MLVIIVLAYIIDILLEEVGKICSKECNWCT